MSPVAEQPARTDAAHRPAVKLLDLGIPDADTG
jgi:hypothetical protein